jgi:hypothetical protein
MLFDKQNQFSDAQAVTVDAISSNVIDTLPMTSNPNTVQNLGGLAAMFLCIQVTETFATTVSVTITLESDSTADLATSATVHINTGAIPVATLVAGYTLFIPLPIGNYERYLGVRYDVSTSATAGKFNAFLTREVQNWKPYASGSASI